MKPNKDNTKSPTVLTKAGTEGAKDIDSCLLCSWTFPRSFRGEEKNVHMDRCMENKSDEDKKFWLKCQGDLKLYMFGFGEQSQGRTAKKKDVGHQKEPELEDSSQIPRKIKKVRKKKEECVIQIDAGNFDTPNGYNEDGEEEKIKFPRELMTKFEPPIKKKLKAEESQAKDNGEKKTQTRVLLLPVVKDLVFDPSKEFTKRSKK